MGRQKVPVEIVDFSGGFITEVSPMNFPVGGTFDEFNMELNRDKTRERRLGFDLLDETTNIESAVRVADKNVGHSRLIWENAGGDFERELLVVQLGTHLAVFETTTDNPADNLIYEETFSTDTYSLNWGMDVVDDTLVVANGLPSVSIYEYNEGVVTKTSENLKARDRWGVEVVYDGEDLSDGSGVMTRPGDDVDTDTHIYNLRNQSWGTPRAVGTEATTHRSGVEDPISQFRNATTGVAEDLYPSNSDMVNYAFYADAAASGGASRTVERFFAKDIEQQITGTTPAPQGFFIIDLLDRGASRRSEITRLYARHTELENPITIGNLPLDQTSGGPSAVAEYAGRAWFAGFDSTITDGDNQSPKLGSYVAYSQLVRKPSDIIRCYQDADPTSTEDSALVDTDGGLIRIDGAYGIQRLVPISNGLFVLASNGVWRVSGGEDFNFKATEFSVDRISDVGVVSSNSAVIVDDSFVYWGNEAIYHVKRNDYGAWIAQNITQETIQTFYDSILPEFKVNSFGIFDSFERKIRWVWQQQNAEDGYVELVLDVDRAAWTKNRVAPFTDTTTMTALTPLSAFKVAPYSVSQQATTITVQGVTVTVNGASVTVPSRGVSSTVKEVQYIVFWQNDAGRLVYNFASYNDFDLYDWASLVINPSQPNGIDSQAYIETGAMMGDDSKRPKGASYLHTSFLRTESTSGEEIIDPSSCLISSQWGWTLSPSTNKWSRRYQAYRHPKLEELNVVDNYQVIDTRSKVRGSGKSVAFRFESEPGKKMHMLSWSFDLIVRETS